MAQGNFQAYHADVGKGRLFVALLMYSATKKVPALNGNEAILIPAMKWNIEKDNETHEEYAPF